MIDAVITWVDGNDPVHRKKRAQYSQSLSVQDGVATDERFDEVGEFEYCLVALVKNLPWLRKIFIVTDAQIPSFLKYIDESAVVDKIEIVDHKVLFEGYEQFLPTFNCRSIHSLLWRIPNLSEKYIYLDDDFVVLRPLLPDYFFRGNSLRLVGDWKKQYGKRWYDVLFNRNGKHREKKRPGNRYAQSFSAKLVGFEDSYFKSPHAFHPQFKSLQKIFYEQNSSLLEENISYRFRSEHQFIPTSITNHLALKQNRAVTSSNLRSMRFDLDSISLSMLKAKLYYLQINQLVTFICLQNLNMANAEVKSYLFQWLDRHVGTVSGLTSCS